MIKPGNYLGQRNKDAKIQMGETENTGNLQIAIDMDLYDEQNQLAGTMTTFLVFTDKSAVYSYERLTLLGWNGKGASDIDRLDGLDNRVPCRVTAPESYTANDGTTKQGSSKLEILTGAGTVVISKPVDAATFKARLAALGGGGGGGNSTAGGNDPPF